MAKIKRTWVKKYTVVKPNMGEGGNAIVHLVNDDRNFTYALKELNVFSNEKKARFSDEIKIMTENSDLTTIMPIVDSSEEEFWYVMPVAESVAKAFDISKFDDFDIIQGLLVSLASSLCEIHERNLAHRDIKPDNIYILNGTICFGDFGLVGFPDNPNNFTRSDRGLGATFTIAPEMKRNPKVADGKKADVYSLAKTMWILLTGETKGFDGQYLVNGDYTLRNYEHLRGKHLVELENLLQQATSFDPDTRPTIEKVVFELKKWRNVSEDSEQYQISEWDFLNKCLFGDVTPDTAIWSDRKSVIKVLNVISSLPVFNHMLFSDKGGLDFKKATEANEDGCIEIIDDCGWCYILKPQKLYFERFVDPSWNYFLLVMDKLNPVLIEDERIHREYLVEDKPGSYVSAEFVQYGVYDYDSGEKLPDGAKEVCRFTDGTLLFIMKSGFYNSIYATYDGRHGMCHPLQFRQYIEDLCKITDNLKIEGYSSEMIERVLNHKHFSKNPFEEDDTINDEDDFCEKNSDDDRSKFIKNHLMSWSFTDITNGLSTVKVEECKAIYFIEYQDNEFIFSDFIDGKGMVICSLCIDGKFKGDDGSQTLYFNSAKEADKVFSQCNQRIIDECDKAGIDDYGYCHLPQVRLLRGKIKPNHLFTEDEIRDLMRVSDDRKNNTLVIDVDGFARIISGEMKELFPVQTESWDAGNVYVGKYSNLTDARPAYMRALNGWLKYLETGRPQYVDYTESENEEELMVEIKKFY